MASNYGLNFGFRRSDISISMRDGRSKTPATGNALLLGTAVQLDPANPGYLKQAAANAAPKSGLSGILVQEEDHIEDFQLFSVPGHTSLDLGTAVKDKLAIMWSGQGVKIWLKNTGNYSRFGVTKDPVTIVDTTGVAVGDSLGWDGSKWVKSDGTTTPHWLTVTAVTSGYVEAVLTF